MKHAIERSHAAWTPAGSIPATLVVTVVFTNREDTLVALKQAAALAAELHAEVLLLYPQIVPYPLPLDQPNLSATHIEWRLVTLAESSAPESSAPESSAPETPAQARSAIDTRIRVLLCRDAAEALRRALPPRSVVLIAGRRRRCFASSEQRLAHALEQSGHHVIFIPRPVRALERPAHALDPSARPVISIPRPARVLGPSARPVISINRHLKEKSWLTSLIASLQLFFSPCAGALRGLVTAFRKNS